MIFCSSWLQTREITRDDFVTRSNNKFLNQNILKISLKKTLDLRFANLTSLPILPELKYFFFYFNILQKLLQLLQSNIQGGNVIYESEK